MRSRQAHSARILSKCIIQGKENVEIRDLTAFCIVNDFIFNMNLSSCATAKAGHDAIAAPPLSLASTSLNLSRPFLLLAYFEHSCFLFFTEK